MKIRNQKSYIKSLPDGTPPVRTGVTIAPYVYFALLFSIIAYLVYFVTTNMLAVQAYGYIETAKYPMQAYQDGVLTEIAYQKGDEVAVGNKVFNIVFVPNDNGDEPMEPIPVRNGQTLSTADALSVLNSASLDSLLSSGQTVLLSDSPRYSPITGKVSKLERGLYEFVKQGDPVLTLEDPSKVKLKAFFDRATLKYVKVGKDADIVFGDGRESKGTITAVGSAALEHQEQLKKGYLPLEVYVLVEIAPSPGEEAVWAEHDQLDARVRVKK